MPIVRREVKWGGLVLRGDRIGKEDAQHRETTKGRRIGGVGRRIKAHIKSYPCIQKQPLSTRKRIKREGGAVWGEGGYMGPGLVDPNPPLM
jgi:hypothetical protein